MGVIILGPEINLLRKINLLSGKIQVFRVNYAIKWENCRGCS